MSYVIPIFRDQDLWSPSPPSLQTFPADMVRIFPDNNRQSGFSPTMVQKWSTGYKQN